MSILEPGRKRRHRVPLGVLALWGVAIGFAVAIAIAFVALRFG